LWFTTDAADGGLFRIEPVPESDNSALSN